jgi:quinohemoprotein ethanol dehydrogenase
MEVWRFLTSAVAALVVSARVTAAPASVGNVTDAGIVSQSGTGENWLVNGGDFGQAHFSPLKSITRQNIDHLGLTWWLDIDSPMGLAVEPIVVDGTIFLSGTLDRVFAIDAASGKLRWRFDPHVRMSNINNSHYALTNKGVAVWNGMVFIGTGDCRMIGIDAASGKQVWESPICVDSTQTGIGGAPRVGGGKVYIGYGGDTAARGSVVALDAKTGKLVWRFWNVPGDPSKGFENKTLEMAARTWHGKDWWRAGGGGVWEPITYDPKTNLLIYGTQDPSEGPEDAIETSGERLFTNCIVAVRADTGQFAWYFPTKKYAPVGYPSPENFHVLVSDLLIKGEMRHVVMTVPRFGSFFVIDAQSGKLISEKSLAQRPAMQLSAPTPSGAPRTTTGHTWWPMSYSRSTGLVYIPTYDDVDDVEKTFGGYGGTAVGRLIAWDPIKQSARWSIAQQFPVNGGVLSTAGGLVFQGEGTGEFSAYAADSGHKVWSVKTGSAIESIPVTFSLKGEQYILLPVGLGSASRLFAANSTMATPETKRGPARLYAFKLGATTSFPTPHVVVPRVPKPPNRIASDDMVLKGKEIFLKNMCWTCHGGWELDGSGAWILNGAVPDLRYMPPEVHDQFLAIVMGGSRRPYGMVGFADGQSNYPVITPMTLAEANALHAFIIDLQWKAYNADHHERPDHNISTPEIQR